MTYRFSTSFDRSFWKLSTKRRQRVHGAVYRLMALFHTGQLPAGLGLKRLRKTSWEHRVGLGDRVVLTLEGGLVTFVLVGNHEDVQRYLKNL